MCVNFVAYMHDISLSMEGVDQNKLLQNTYPT